MTYRPPSKKEKAQYWQNVKQDIISIITFLSIVIVPVLVISLLVYSTIYNPQLITDILLPLFITAILSLGMTIVLYEPIESYYYMKKRKRNGYYANFMNSTFRAILGTALVSLFLTLDIVREKYLYMTEELAEKREQYIEQLVTDLKKRYTNINVVTKESIIRPIEKYDVRHVLLPHYYYLEYVLPYDKHAEYSDTWHIQDIIHKDIQQHARADEWNKCLEYLENEVGKAISIHEVKNLMN